MGEFSVEGQDLKKMIKIARKQPVPFAFNPGKSDPEHYLGMHRKRAPATIGKVAKKEGTGTKVAFGMAKVDGNLLNLTCERTLTGLAKRFKKYLKYNKITLNVQILDADGTVLESDVEDDLPDDPSLYDEDIALVDSGSTTTDADARQLVMQITEQRDRIKTLAGNHQKRLSEPIQRLISLLKDGALDQVHDDLAKITEVIDRLLADTASPDTPSQAELLADFKAMDGQIRALMAAQNTASAKMKEVAQAFVASIKSGKLDVAEKLLAGARKLVAAEKAAREIPEGIVAKRSYLVTRWQAVPAELKVEIETLTAAIAGALPYERPDELQQAIESSLNGLVAEMKSAIDDALDASINAGDAKYGKVSNAVDLLQSELANNVILQALKNNAVTAGDGFEAAFISALNDVETAMTR